MRKLLDRNPEDAAMRGCGAIRSSCEEVSELNPKLKDTQFADYHGHGWNFRARLQARPQGQPARRARRAIVAADDPKKFQKAVHLSSIHVDVGMQCVDCHFAQDNHGNGHLHGEVAQAVEIDCKDCHGTARRATRTCARPAPRPAPIGARPLGAPQPDGKRRFEWIGGKLIQRSAVTPGLEWKVSLVKDTVTPGIAQLQREGRARAS